MSFGQNERKARLNRRSGCDIYLTIVKKGFIKPQIGSNGKMVQGRVRRFTGGRKLASASPAAEDRVLQGSAGRQRH
jgi:hypothetical protein